MHFLPDTNEHDGLQERYWPDAFKQVIRREIEPAVRSRVDGQAFGHIHTGFYADRYPNLEAFLDRIVNLVVIGAENGSDTAFENIYSSFLKESPLPRAKTYAAYFWPPVLSPEIQKTIGASISAEYADEEGLQYAYRAGYAGEYKRFADFVEEISRLMVAGIANGIDDMLGKIYRSFLARRDLPLGRRNPKRLKDW